jgi:hypothetical protein
MLDARPQFDDSSRNYRTVHTEKDGVVPIFGKKRQNRYTYSCNWIDAFIYLVKRHTYFGWRVVMAAVLP